VSAHDLNDETTLMGESSIKDIVDGITDTGQG
jgi:hypothetical protein